jgi:hypothetical protein
LSDSLLLFVRKPAEVATCGNIISHCSNAPVTRLAGALFIPFSESLHQIRLPDEGAAETDKVSLPTNENLLHMLKTAHAAYKEKSHATDYGLHRF